MITDTFTRIVAIAFEEITEPFINTKPLILSEFDSVLIVTSVGVVLAMTEIKNENIRLSPDVTTTPLDWLGTRVKDLHGLAEKMTTGCWCFSGIEIRNPGNLYLSASGRSQCPPDRSRFPDMFQNS